MKQKILGSLSSEMKNIADYKLNYTKELRCQK